MIYLRQLYKQKPQAYGPPSQVQSSIFANADRAGIDPGRFLRYFPAMEGAGSAVRDVTRDYLIDIDGSVTHSGGWDKNGLKFSGSEHINAGYYIGESIEQMKRVTVFYTVNPASILADADIFSRFGDSTQYRQFKIWLDVDGVGVGYAAAIYTGSDYIVIGVNTANATLNKEKTIIVQFDPTDFAVYDSNGRYASSNYTTVKDVSILSSIEMIGASGGNISGNKWQGIIQQVGAVSDNLTPSQIAYLSDNPYFLLHRVPSVFYSVPSGAITLRQFGFRFYQDNADHTPIGTENDASVSLAPGSKFRIRMGIVKE